MSTPATNEEAEAALASIEQRRRQVIAEIDLPRWYWWGLALGWIALGVVTDLGHPWLTLAATIVFGAVHATIAQRAIDGRHRSDRLTVRADVVGRRAPQYVIAGLLALAAVDVVLAFGAVALGLGHPVTAASVVVAVIILVGGPRLMALIRRRAIAASDRP